MKIITTSAWILGLTIAATIFFQLHVTLPGGVININIADPIAILSLAAAGLHFLLLKKLPQWRIKNFNKILTLISALLLIGFIIGWMKIGITQWALTGRLIGWVVLLGYLAAGYLLTAYAGAKAICCLLKLLTTAAVLIIIWHIILRVFHNHGFQVPPPTNNFEGFSGNRNAFAFQLLAVMTLLLAYSRAYPKQLSGNLFITFATSKTWLSLGFLIAGVLWSGSRAGMLAMVFILVIGAFKKIADRRLVTAGSLLAMLLWSNLQIMQSAISNDDSNQERWATWIFSYKMWRDSPFFGEGLGVFVANSTEWFGHPTVIHSTPLWILAEFGLLGVVFFGFVIIKIGRYSIAKSPPVETKPRAALFLLLLLFIIFSQFHEMFYQRIFWFISGALLATPETVRIKNP